MLGHEMPSTCVADEHTHGTAIMLRAREEKESLPSKFDRARVEGAHCRLLIWFGGLHIVGFDWNILP
jgi:hypothetical protein